MASVTWSDEARSDLRVIHDRVSRRDPRAADRLIDRLYAAASALADFPEIGGMVEEFGDPRIRERIVGKYRLIYSLNGSGCRVLNVIRGERDLRRVIRLSDLQ